MKKIIRVNSTPISNREPIDHREAIEQRSVRVRGGHKRGDLYSIKIKKIKKTGGIRHHRYAHTDARNAKKDVISTKPQKAMGAERTFPREQKRKSTTNDLLPRLPLPNAAVLGACYPV